MHRRRFIASLGAAITAARTLRAQQKAMPVIGWLSALSPAVQGGDRMPEAGTYGSLPVATLSALAAFAKGLNEAGYVEGKNLAIEYRWAEGHPDWLPALADLVARQVDVIVAVAGNAAARAAKGATSTIPIVFTTVQDSVETGLVASLARPEGNLTGFVYSPSDLDPKRLELISELVPKAGTIGLLVHPPTVETYTRMMQDAAHAKGVQLLVLEASNDIEATFGSLIGLHAGALVVQSDPFFTQRGQQLVTLAAQYALPATYHLRGFVAAGGLISYGPRFQELYRGAGTYVGRILAGAKAADLPVRQATTFELVVNLKAANALGLIVPPAILARADEVIE
jgi:putative tryptophan/tyrosine transport system substrate-binding protein